MKIDPFSIMASLGAVLTLLWPVMLLKNRREYTDITSTKAARRLKLYQFFPVGFALIKLFKINVRGEGFAERRKNISVVYGARYAHFYAYLFTGAQITYAAMLLPAGLLAGAVLRNSVIGFLGVSSSVLMLFYLDAEVRKKASEKKDALLCELPETIMRLALLLNAGMVLRDAWKMISESSDSVLCLEMKKVNEDIRNGISETEAFEAFGDRCGTRETRRLVSSIIQNIKKGNMGLSLSLQDLASEQWEEKKNYVRKKAGAAEQKLLFPMLMIFSAIITMIVVPVFTNIL